MTFPFTPSFPVAAAAVVWLSAAASPAVATDLALRHDVFSRPTLQALAPPVVVAPAPAPLEASPWRPTLRAIMLAGERPTVLVDRSFVELGERLDGYLLIAVGEDRAVFAKGRQRVELLLGRTWVDVR